MLETEIKKLTAAVEALTAKIEGGAALAAATTAAPAAAETPILATVPIATSPAADPLAALTGAAPAAPAVEIPAAAAPAAPVATADAADKKSVTQAAIALGKAKGSAVLRQVLAEFAAENVSSIRPDQYSAAYAKLQAALA